MKSPRETSSVQRYAESAPAATLRNANVCSVPLTVLLNNTESCCSWTFAHPFDPGPTDPGAPAPPGFRASSHNFLTKGASALFGQFLFSYKVNPRTVLFVGYSDNSLADQNVGLTRTNRTVFVKVGYAWVL